MTQDVKRLLKIKIDALKRLEKDYTLYKQEEITQYQKVERFKSDSTKDIYDVKKQEEILDETKRMIIDSVSRVTSYIVSLSEFMDEHKDQDDGSDIWIESYETIDRLSTKFLNEQ